MMKRESRHFKDQYMTGWPLSSEIKLPLKPRWWWWLGSLIHLNNQQLLYIKTPGFWVECNWLNVSPKALVDGLVHCSAISSYHRPLKILPQAIKTAGGKYLYRCSISVFTKTKYDLFGRKHSVNLYLRTHKFTFLFWQNTHTTKKKNTLSLTIPYKNRDLVIYCILKKKL